MHGMYVNLWCCSPALFVVTVDQCKVYITLCVLPGCINTSYNVPFPTELQS